MRRTYSAPALLQTTSLLQKILQESKTLTPPTSLSQSQTDQVKPIEVIHDKQQIFEPNLITSVWATNDEENQLDDIDRNACRIS